MADDEWEILSRSGSWLPWRTTHELYRNRSGTYRLEIGDATIQFRSVTTRHEEVDGTYKATGFQLARGASAQFDYTSLPPDIELALIDIKNGNSDWINDSPSEGE